MNSFFSASDIQDYFEYILRKHETVTDVSHLEITEVVLINFNIINNDYKHNSRVLYTFVPNKSFDQLLDVSPNIFMFLKTFNSKFSYIQVWFIDQHSKPRESEGKINIRLVIN